MYDVSSFSLVNDVPFRSIRQAAKAMPISASTLPEKIDTGIPFIPAKTAGVKGITITLLHITHLSRKNKKMD